ncbi:MAG: hypothetical protein U0Q18_27415 [Bryobacteraceae bacterium]
MKGRSTGGLGSVRRFCVPDGLKCRGKSQFEFHAGTLRCAPTFGAQAHELLPAAPKLIVEGAFVADQGKELVGTLTIPEKDPGFEVLVLPDRFAAGLDSSHTFHEEGVFVSGAA